MSMSEIVDRVLAGGMNLVRTRVARVDADGGIHVALEGKAVVRCDVLAGAALARAWGVGDEALVALPQRGRERPILLGAIASGLPAAPAAEAGAPPAPAATPGTASPADTSTVRNTRVVVEAGEELVLRCGTGTITLSKDGKIVIRGEHVLSRARGTQRIKGGSVAIN